MTQFFQDFYLFAAQINRDSPYFSSSLLRREKWGREKWGLSLFICREGTA